MRQLSLFDLPDEVEANVPAGKRSLPWLDDYTAMTSDERREWNGFQVSDWWFLTMDGDPECREFFNDHYSRRRYADGRQPKLFVGPGRKLVLRTDPAMPMAALFVWREELIRDDGQTGYNCAVFRSTLGHLVAASELILDAEEIARMMWGSDRLFTYVNPSEVRSRNPGYCFKRAGWKHTGTSGKGLHLLEKNF